MTTRNVGDRTFVPPAIQNRTTEAPATRAPTATPTGAGHTADSSFVPARSPSTPAPLQVAAPNPGPLSLNTPAAKEAINSSLAYLSKQAGVAGVAPDKGLVPRSVEVDSLGMTHVRMDRVQDGVKVLGEQMITHLREGKVVDTTGAMGYIPPGLAKQPTKLSADQALASAKQSFGQPLERDPVVEKVIVRGDDGAYKTAYRVELTNFTAGPLPQKMNYLIDANSGQTMSKWNQLGGIELPPKAAAAPITVTGSAAPNAAVKDNAKVESIIKIDKDVTIDSLSANLNIPHTYKGDLVVSLVSPSGKTAVIHNRTGGSADNVTGKFDLSAFKGESSKGDWKLVVEDKAGGDVGTLKNWDLSMTGVEKTPPPPPSGTVNISKTATPNAAIKDNATTTSTIDVTDDAKLDAFKLNLDIAHTYRGDLKVSVTSPSGKTVVVSDKAGGSADDLKGEFDLSTAFKGEATKGTWKITVEDTAAQDVGTLKSWGFTATGTTGGPPPPPPPPPPAGGTDDTSLYSGKVKIDAQQNADGSYSLNDVNRGKGVETRDAKNAQQAGNTTAFKDANNIWGEAGDDARSKAAVDAHYGAQTTYDFYRDVLGRNSIDGNGEKLVSNVHIGNNYVNAYWDGSQMNYGDGNGRDASALTTLDIAGHEITHGLTERTAGLIYSGESGGINESMSDIMGAGVEWYAAQKNPAVKSDWLLGEDAWTPGTAGDALRYMNDPTKDGYSVDHYSNYPKQTEVHGSSGIMNNAFTLLVDGGTNKTSKETVNGGIGMEKGLKIYGRALTTYMTPNTTFAQAREACIKAATDLYGAGSVEVQKVKDSWSAVGLK